MQKRRENEFIGKNTDCLKQNVLKNPQKTQEIKQNKPMNLSILMKIFQSFEDFSQYGCDHNFIKDTLQRIDLGTSFHVFYYI